MSAQEKQNETLEAILAVAEKIAEPLGLNVVAVRFAQQGRKRTLEVTIHRHNGAVSLDDCEHVSRALDQYLDEQTAQGSPLVEGPYMLEVQSPGIDRQLKSEREFRIFAGHKVIVQAREKVNGLGDKFIATLVGVDSGVARFEQLASAQENTKKKEAIPQELTLDLERVAQIKLYSDLLTKNKNTTE